MNDSTIEGLTKREREVLGLIGQGLSLAEIADKLYRSQKTIQTHRLSLGRKLGASNRVELARIAIKAGLAPLESDTVHEQNPGDNDEAGDGWQLFQRIEGALPAVGGPAYFHQLARALARELGVKYAGISELQAERQTFYTLALIEDGTLAEDLSYPVHGSACEATLNQHEISVEHDARARFPRDEPLIAMGGEAYLGVRLDSVAGKPMGVLWAVHDQALREARPALRAMQRCAKRAAAELQRWRALDQLRELREELERRVEDRTADLAEANQRLAESVAQLEAAQAEAAERGTRFEALVEMMGDGFVVVDREARATYTNRRFAEMLQREPSELLGHRPNEWLIESDGERFLERFKSQIGGRYYGSYVLPSGKTVQALISARPIYDREGQHDGSYAVITQLPLPAEPD